MAIMESTYLIQRRLRKLGIIEPDKKPVANKIPIRAVKRLSQERLYSKKKKAYLINHIQCEVPGCNKISEELHHKKGRIGSLLTNEKFFMGVCIEHHRKIEDFPDWAKENGFSLSRLKV